MNKIWFAVVRAGKNTFPCSFVVCKGVLPDVLKKGLTGKKKGVIIVLNN